MSHPSVSLHNGNCLEIMKDLEDNSIDLMFCDLPYGQTNCKWDTPIDLDLFWKQVNRICKINCPMFFTCTTKFGVNLINSNPKNFRYELIWVKSTVSGHLLSKKQPLRKTEMIYVFYRKQPFYDLSSHKSKFSITDEKRPEYHTDSELYGKIARPDYKRKNGESIYEPNLPTNILEIKSEKRKHSTQKPVALMSWLIKYYTREGDTVLDPTMGSGSTGVSCKDMKRNFIGIELNKDIFKIAAERTE